MNGFGLSVLESDGDASCAPGSYRAQINSSEADKKAFFPSIHLESHEVPIFIFRYLNTAANLPFSAL